MHMHVHHENRSLIQSLTLMHSAIRGLRIFAVSGVVFTRFHAQIINIAPAYDNNDCCVSLMNIILFLSLNAVVLMNRLTG